MHKSDAGLSGRAAAAGSVDFNRNFAPPPNLDHSNFGLCL